jgi:hypothetical protein
MACIKLLAFFTDFACLLVRITYAAFMTWRDLENRCSMPHWKIYENLQQLIFKCYNNLLYLMMQSKGNTVPVHATEALGKWKYAYTHS